MKINKNPCKLCLVRPSCSSPCLDKYDHAKAKLSRLKIVHRNLSPSVASIGALLFLLLNFLVQTDQFYIVIMAFCILMLLCVIVMIIQIRYLIPQIIANETLIEVILNKLNGDWV